MHGNVLCMRLFLDLSCIPTPGGNRAHDRLPAEMHMDMLDRHLLLAFAAVSIKRIEQQAERPRKLVRLDRFSLRPSKVE